MPQLETMDMGQAAVLWRFLYLDDHGETIIDEPEEITVRWVRRQTQMLNGKGDPIAVDATVVADIEIPTGSIMWEGELEEYYGTGSAGEEDSLMEVVASGMVPDLKARDIRRRHGLTFYKNTRPRMEGEPAEED